MIEEYLVTDILDAELLSEVIGGISADPYEGEYEVTPKTMPQTLPTENKLLENNVLVKEIPFAKVSNASGTTVIIGG